MSALLNVVLNALFSASPWALVGAKNKRFPFSDSMKMDNHLKLS